MEDGAYARELLRILTRPVDPDLLPGHLDADWIDRHDGFGTDLRVTSIDVVPGEHGAQIDIGFVLDLPAGSDLPDRGSLLLPVDREWREVSGFDEPQDYAPRVASQLMRNIGALHSRLRPAHLHDVPSRDEQHALLLHVLSR